MWWAAIALTLGAVVSACGCAGNATSGDWSGQAGGSTDANHVTAKAPARDPEAAPAAGDAGKSESVNLLDARPESIGSQSRGLLRVGAYLDILRVEVPLHTLSDSQELWQYLDEQAIGAERIVTLKRNGLRVGVGRSESWGPIKAILDRVEDRFIYHESASLDMGVLSLEVSMGPEDQTIFFFRGGDQMVGESFPASHNMLQISYEIRPDDPGRLALRIVPEIRQKQQKMTWSRRGTGYVRVPVYRGRVLHELAVGVSLSSGAFVAIGPGREIELHALIGRVLLTRDVEGKRYESIYFLTPQLVQRGSRSG